MQLVVLLELWESLCGHFAGPMVGGGQKLWLGRKQGGKLDIAATAYPQQAGVFASAAALHGGGDHHGRNRNSDSRVERGEHHGLCPAPAGPGHGDPLGIHIRKLEKKIDRPQRAIGLHAHHVLQVGFRLRAKQAPTVRRVHLRPHRFHAMR